MQRGDANSGGSKTGLGPKIFRFLSSLRVGRLNVQRKDHRAHRHWSIKFGRQNPHGNILRPGSLSEFIGQKQMHANLDVFIKAARLRCEALDHVLLVGPPGLGKTTLAHIVARELGAGIRTTTGAAASKPGVLRELIEGVRSRDVIFIDEIHRLGSSNEETIYSAMEDYRLDCRVGKSRKLLSGSAAIAPFTLIGATTRAGLLSQPLRDRFGITVRLEFYSEAELEQIVERGSVLLGMSISSDGAKEIARRARATPRIAMRLLQRVRDFGLVMDLGAIDQPAVASALAEMDIDDFGLDATDRRYLSTIALEHGGGPVGVDSLAAVLSESREVIEEVVEPFLIRDGLVKRTARGRIITVRGCLRVGLQPAKSTLDDSQSALAVRSKSGEPVH